jgi:hypothetical protein
MDESNPCFQNTRFESITHGFPGPIAQWSEQATHNPRTLSSYFLTSLIGRSLLTFLNHDLLTTNNSDGVFAFTRFIIASSIRPAASASAWALWW